jgi:hypothetical protein
MTIDVFIDTGVCVRVPSGTDAESPEGCEAIKVAAREQFIAMISGGSFDITFGQIGE